MLRLREKQFAHLDAVARHDFVSRIASFLRTEFDASLANVPDDALRQMIEAKIVEARNCGLEIERDIVLYIYSAAALGPAFPDRHPRLLETVTDETIAYDDRCEAVARAIDGQHQ